MQLTVTKSSCDDVFTVVLVGGTGTRPTVPPYILQSWLSNLGVSDATINNILRLEPGASLTVDVPLATNAKAS